MTHSESSNAFAGNAGLHFRAAWQVDHTVGPFSGTAAYGVTSGRMDFHRCEVTGVTPSGDPIVNCSLSQSTMADGFDGLTLVNINGTAYRDTDGIVSVEGDRVISTPEKINGLKTTIQHDFLGPRDLSASVVRILVTLKNTGRRTLARTIDIGTRLGSGAGTTVTASSTGDALLTSADSWFVTQGAGDGEVGLARGDASKDALHADPAGDGDWIDRYALKIKPKKTVQLLYFAHVARKDNSVSITPDYEDMQALADAGLLDGLTDGQIAQIKNWLPAS